MKEKNRQKFWILTVIALGVAAAVLALLFRPTTAKTEPEFQAKLVRTQVVEKSEQRITVTAYGTVQPNRDLTLRSEVSGRVVEQSPNLVVGGTVSEGEVLLRLDQRDYQNVVEQEKAAVERAKFELQLEKGRQVVAKREWEQIGPSIKKTELSEELALRKPHLREKKAALEAAQSRLEKALLDLSRTVITSPMDAVVVSEAVEKGDYVTPQTEIARIAGTKMFRVQVSVPVDKLKWIRFPPSSDPSEVEVVQDVGGRTVVRKGKILRLLANLDPSGRMARILVGVEDPLGLEKKENGKFPLLIGTYSRVVFEGPLVQDVVVLPRLALRENDKVWIKNKDNLLEVREVGILQKREGSVLVDQGIEGGEEVVVSNLPLAIPGMRLRTIEQSEEERGAE